LYICTQKICRYVDIDVFGSNIDVQLPICGYYWNHKPDFAKL